jgi:hypothetical protein
MFLGVGPFVLFFQFNDSRIFRKFSGTIIEFIIW